MLPLIAIGGAISAVASVIKGASWLSDKLGSPKAATAPGGTSRPSMKPPLSGAVRVNIRQRPSGLTTPVGCTRKRSPKVVV